MRSDQAISLVICIGAMMLAGCFGLARVNFSEPYLDPPERFRVDERYVGEMFHVDDVELRVEPFNSRSTGFLLLPVPLPVRPEALSKPPFLIYLALRAYLDEFQLDPSRVVLARGATSAVPSKITGPYLCGSVAPRPEERPLPVPRIPLPVGLPICLWLEFPVPPPPPEEPFSITLEGLTQSETPYPLPPVHFRPSRRIDVLGVQ